MTTHVLDCRCIYIIYFNLDQLFDRTQVNSNITVTTLLRKPTLMCFDAETITREEWIEYVEMHSTGGIDYSKKIHQKGRTKNGHRRIHQNPFLSPALWLI